MVIDTVAQRLVELQSLVETLRFALENPATKRHKFIQEMLEPVLHVTEHLYAKVSEGRDAIDIERR